MLRRKLWLPEGHVERQHHLKQVTAVAGKCEHEKVPFACGLPLTQRGLAFAAREASRAAPGCPARPLTPDWAAQWGEPHATGRLSGGRGGGSGGPRPPDWPWPKARGTSCPRFAARKRAIAATPLPRGAEQPSRAAFNCRARRPHRRQLSAPPPVAPAPGSAQVVTQREGDGAATPKRPARRRGEAGRAVWGRGAKTRPPPYGADFWPRAPARGKTWAQPRRRKGKAAQRPKGLALPF